MSKDLKGVLQDICFYSRRPIVVPPLPDRSKLYYSLYSFRLGFSLWKRDPKDTPDNVSAGYLPMAPKRVHSEELEEAWSSNGWAGVKPTEAAALANGSKNMKSTETSCLNCRHFLECNAL